MDAATLETLSQVSFSDGVPGNLTTAHPTRLADGSLLNFTRSTPFGGFHLYKQNPATLARREIAYVPDANPMAGAWVHDFAVTRNYAVIVEAPLYFNLGSLLLGTSTEHVFMDWRAPDGCRVHVVALDGSRTVKTYTAPPFFVFHFANAYEAADGRTLHVDLGMYDDPSILNQLSLANLGAFPGAPPPRE